MLISCWVVIHCQKSNFKNVSLLFRSIPQSIRTLALVLEFCLRSKGSKVSSRVGFQPCLDTVHRGPASSVSTSSSRSTTLILLVLRTLSNTRHWSSLQDLHLLKLSLMLLSARLRPLRFVSKLNLALLMAWLMDFPSSSRLKEPQGTCIPHYNSEYYSMKTNNIVQLKQLILFSKKNNTL